MPVGAVQFAFQHGGVVYYAVSSSIELQAGPFHPSSRGVRPAKRPAYILARAIPPSHHLVGAISVCLLSFDSWACFSMSLLLRVFFAGVSEFFLHNGYLCGSSCGTFTSFSPVASSVSLWMGPCKSFHASTNMCLNGHFVFVSFLLGGGDLFFYVFSCGLWFFCVGSVHRFTFETRGEGVFWCDVVGCLGSHLSIAGQAFCPVFFGRCVSLILFARGGTNRSSA